MMILASNSPRRKELMKKITDDYKVIPSTLDESTISEKNPYDLPVHLALAKAQEVATMFPHEIVIGADSVVILDNEIFGKPHNRENAYKMLKRLSGRIHHVVTGFAIIKGTKIISQSVTTEIYFYELADDLINEYIDQMQPFDKAGSYGIQDKKFKLVEKIIGSYDNVVGFPTDEIKSAIDQIR